MKGDFTPMPIEDHPLAALFPLIEGQALQDLTDDIRVHGLREPIVLLDEKILDGRNRHRACLAAGVEPEFEAYEGDDPVAYVVSRNLHRRHLNESQRAMVAARLANLAVGSNQHVARVTHDDLTGEKFDPPRRVASANWRKPTRDQASGLMNVGTRSIERAAKVIDQAIPEVAAKVDAGKLSVSAASKVSKLPAAQQREIADKNDEELRTKLRELGEAAQKHKARMATLPSKEEALAISKETGDMVRANDGKLHVFVPEAERLAYEIWSSIKPEVEAIAETVHTPQQFADSADDFWLPKFPAVLGKAIAFLTEAKQLMEERYGTSQVAAE